MLRRLWGGLRRYVRELVCGLLERGEGLTVFSIGDWSERSREPRGESKA
jgi:hypothetical protein